MFFKKVSVHKAGRTQETTTTTFRKLGSERLEDSAHPRAKPQIWAEERQKIAQIIPLTLKRLKMTVF